MTNTIYGLFEEIVKKQPEAVAISENKRRMTFRELSDMVDKIAGSFPDGTKAVGIVMRHRVEMIASILAVLKSGAMYIPAEPTFPTGRIHYMMDEAKVDFVLTEMLFSSKLDTYELIYSDCAICMAAPGSETRVYKQDEGDLAYILYTSGTTGRPKGVSVTNKNVCHYVRAFENEFHPKQGDIMLQYSVCSFDIFVEEIFTSLLNGAALAIPSDDDKKDIKSLMAFVERHNVTMLSGFPYLLAEMNQLDSSSGVEQSIVRPFTDEEGLSYMIAYIVPKENGLKVSQVRRELSENLPSFMIPEFIVKMPQIPLNSNGKPDMARMPVVMKE